MQRADKAGLDQIIKPLLADKTYNACELTEKIDFTLLFAIVHEVPDKKPMRRGLCAFLLK